MPIAGPPTTPPSRRPDAGPILRAALRAVAPALVLAAAGLTACTGRQSPLARTAPAAIDLDAFVGAIDPVDAGTEPGGEPGAAAPRADGPAGDAAANGAAAGGDGADGADGAGEDRATDGEADSILAPSPLGARTPDRPQAPAGDPDDGADADELGDAAGPGNAARPAGPARPRPAETPVPYVVESLVGQINGRPIFADQFFEPIDAQLRANAQRLTVPRFRDEAIRIVNGRLQQLLLNELFLAEAESALTSEQQQGLWYLLTEFRETKEAEVGRGSATQATKRLLEEQGVTLEELVDLEKDKTLIQQLIAQHIRPRVRVSWRDIERAYRRDYDRYNPPARLVVSRILVPETDSALVEAIRTQFTSGESFESVAETIGQGDRPRLEYQLPDGTVDSLPEEFHKALRDRLRGLPEGSTDGPFKLNERSGTLWWIHVVQRGRPEGRSIYEPEVQAELREAVFEDQYQIEQKRFVDTLLQDGIYDEIEQMNEKLILIALRRYGVAE